MWSNKRTLLRTALFVAAFLAIGFNLLFFRVIPLSALQRASEKQDIPNVIPPEGYAFNDTGGKVLGDPDATERRLHQIREKMNIYRERKGKLPLGEAASDFVADMFEHPKEYGFKNASEVKAVITNPDAKYADAYRTASDPNSVNPYLMPAQRPDGSSVGSAKAAGTRDVLAYTNLYCYRNERIFNDGHGTSAPVGFYLVLWEDGQVQRIPHDQVTYAYPQRGPFPECFPGQAGVPKEAYSYMEAKERTLPLNKDGNNPNVARR